MQASNEARKGSRYHRLDDIPTNTFTPRTYQIQLLDSALRRNTILCLGCASSKAFLALMVAKELASFTRIPLTSGGKRTIYLTDSEDEVINLCQTLPNHTDLVVGQSPRCDVDLSESNNQTCQAAADLWREAMEINSILVCHGPVFRDALRHAFVKPTDVHLLIFDDCHRSVEVDNHCYADIVSEVKILPDEVQPHILGLTASIAGTECSNPGKLKETVHRMENTMNAYAETSMLILSERYGCRPKESIVKCKGEDDESQVLLQELLEDILEEHYIFFTNCRIAVDEQTDHRNPTEIPIQVLSECLNILNILGSWCTSSIAEYFVMQLDKIIKCEKNDIHKKFLRCVTTTLRLLTRKFEMNFHPDYDVDELLEYTTPKVQELVKVLRHYKPEVDFIIISNDEESENGDDFSDMSDDDDADSNLSGSEDADENSESQNKSSLSSKPMHIAVKRTADGGHERIVTYSEEEEKNLCGIVFVENRFIAFGLNKVIEEVCSWDENLCFVKSCHITGQGLRNGSGKMKGNKSYKRQEEALRKFRTQECNLVIATQELEEGIDIPKCNLVVRFDPPCDYKSYALSKGRARARDAMYVILLNQENFETFNANVGIFKEIEQVLLGDKRVSGTKKSMPELVYREDYGHDGDTDDEEDDVIEDEDLLLPYRTLPGLQNSPQVTLQGAIALINRYCAKLPSDAFTHLTPQCRVEKQAGDTPVFVAFLRLPINSLVKEELKGPPMKSKKLAKMAVALKMCEILHGKGELDENLVPVGKEMFSYEEEEEWVEEEDPAGQARPGTTKRKQYYVKKVADALAQCRPVEGEPCYLYLLNLRLTGPITDEQNTRGRVIYAPEDTTQTLGLLLSKKIPQMPSFPVYTRSGEVTSSVDMLTSDLILSEEEISQLLKFHHFVFSDVLHLIKDPMEFDPLKADFGCIIVPLNGSQDLTIEWSFVEKVIHFMQMEKKGSFNKQKKKESFTFDVEDFKDAVVMPSYRNIDQPQHFYVAEIRQDLNPLSSFPSPELYKTFQDYYSTKYGLVITNTEQPLLDVDHTSARLNLLTPRYMNQKGVALPTSSAETKRARRENLQQKQILVPELCDVHVFPASLWRKTVCLPAILYRTNSLLLAEELRRKIARETGVGVENLPLGFQFPQLDFGFETNPEKLKGPDSNDGEKNDESCVDQKVSVDGDSKEAGDDTYVETPPDDAAEVTSGSENEDVKGAVESGHDESDLGRDVKNVKEKVDSSASSDSDSGIVSSGSDSNIVSLDHGSQTLESEANHKSLNMINKEKSSLCVETAEKKLSDISCNEIKNVKREEIVNQDVKSNCIPVASRYINSAQCNIYSPEGKQPTVCCSSVDVKTEGSTNSCNNFDSTSSVINEYTTLSTLPHSQSNHQNSTSSSKCHSSIECPPDLGELPGHIASNEPCFISQNVPGSIGAIIDATNTSLPCSSPSLSSVSLPVTSSNLLSKTSQNSTNDSTTVVKMVSPVPVDEDRESSHVALSLPAEIAEGGDPDLPNCNHQSDHKVHLRNHKVQAGQSSKEHVNTEGKPLAAVPCPSSSQALLGCETSDCVVSALPSTSLVAADAQSALASADHGELCPPGINRCDMVHASSPHHSCLLHSDDKDHPSQPHHAGLLSEEVTDCHVLLGEKNAENNHPSQADASITTVPSSTQDHIPAAKIERKAQGTSQDGAGVLAGDGNLKSTGVPLSPRVHEADPAIVMNTLGQELSDLDIDLVCPQASTSETFQEQPCGWASAEWKEPPSKQGCHQGSQPDAKARQTQKNLEEDEKYSRKNEKDFSSVDPATQSDDVLGSQANDSDVIKFSFDAKAPSSKDTDYKMFSPHSHQGSNDKGNSHSSESSPPNTKTLDETNKGTNCSAFKLTASKVGAGTNGVKEFHIGVWNSNKNSKVLASKDKHNEAQPLREDCLLPPRKPSVWIPVANYCANGLLSVSLDADRDLKTFVGPSPCLILQALTMSNANDFFSLERLETIGDSFLKYAITVYLYCSYPGIHEGTLSYLRSKQVCNYNLYRLGRKKHVAEGMVSTKFEPYENWLPPAFVINEDRRRGPVPKVVIVTPGLKQNNSVRNCCVDEASCAGGKVSGSARPDETAQFEKELQWIEQSQEAEQREDLEGAGPAVLTPYSLQRHHGLPDKSVADCVEALIGCYLTTCGRKAALMFMSWLGLKVLPKKKRGSSEKGDADLKKSGEGRQGKTSWQQISEQEFDELRCPPSPMFSRSPENMVQLNHLLEGFEELEEKICYKFQDRSYLLQAFTHASYHYNTITDCYQRVEFLGDAILDYVITRHLYEDSQKYSPGILTDLRSALVNNNIFAALAVKWGFHKYFKAISPSLFSVIDKFVKRQKEKNEDDIDIDEEFRQLEDGEVEEGAEEEEDEEEVEMEIPKALGDIFESVAGAIYLDSGMSLDAVWRVYYRMMKPHIDKYLKSIPKSPVRELLETEPETAKFERPERTLNGRVRVTVNVVGKGVFSGVGRNYRIAKSAAAKKALRSIRTMTQNLIG
ncbi:endoribonuclease Dicer [Aplysia californica]|uniref:Endoribonuclease Dicer n=1 Tax=Aplysia californica TaxID=6500 RepID=A0ABM1A7I5_APLCA|nr:endoribonuclease Dicer [Aplysia californica]